MVSNLIFLEQIALSIAVGALIGVEREHTKHQIITGVRTIALISLLGTLSVMISDLSGNLTYVPYLCLLAVIGYTFLLYYFRAKKFEALGLTTVLTLPLAFILGVLIGFNLYMEAISGAILTTIILLSRDYSHMFVKKLTDEEIADAMLFATICFIIYPIAFVLSPANPISIHGTFSINLQSFLLVVIVVSLISFISFLLMRFWGPKAFPITGFLGGLINSVATVSSLASKSKERPSPLYVTGLAMASSAMLLRNLFLVMLLSPQIFGLILIPVVVMVLVFIFQIFISSQSKVHKTELIFKQPFSVVSGLRFGIELFAVMLLVYVISQFSPRSIGIAAFIGGLASSASVAASIPSNQASLGLSNIACAYLIMIGCFASLLAKIFTLITGASKEFSGRGVPLIVTSMLAGALALIILVH
ncbi:MgtC/SapB family protein [Candidatus Micrarchaeota archaeon]|nr:MgtC/SapB family protein [Candidatus Micrarchaeota archaeon]